MIQRCDDGVSPGPVYMCKKCGKKMMNKTKMKRHAEVHLDVNHSCTICYKSLKTRNALSQHYSSVHGQTVSPTVLWKLTLLFLEFNLALETMIGRVEEEGGTFKYVCNNCGKTMPKKDKMRRHVEVHLDVTHPCAMCDKTFKTRNALSHHYSGVHGQNVSYSRC